MRDGMLSLTLSWRRSALCSDLLTSCTGAALPGA